eukprot:TRINITY_DN13486_c0_g1_i1.p1 TRINITY_DN13486_c0_g1~~TRINITY_DN13486_c0_g1_i1.p1  ORF type:complete len:1302 (+),score=312.54 TRINITY_DN13486_c0_g1_i1:213-4118(+)
MEITHAFFTSPTSEGGASPPSQEGASPPDHDTVSPRAHAHRGSFGSHSGGLSPKTPKARHTVPSSKPSAIHKKHLPKKLLGMPNAKLQIGDDHGDGSFFAGTSFSSMNHTYKGLSARSDGAVMKKASSTRRAGRKSSVSRQAMLMERMKEQMEHMISDHGEAVVNTAATRIQALYRRLMAKRDVSILRLIYKDVREQHEKQEGSRLDKILRRRSSSGGMEDALECSEGQERQVAVPKNGYLKDLFGEVIVDVLASVKKCTKAYKALQCMTLEDRIRRFRIKELRPRLKALRAFAGVVNDHRMMTTWEDVWREVLSALKAFDEEEMSLEIVSKADEAARRIQRAWYKKKLRAACGSARLQLNTLSKFSHNQNRFVVCGDGHLREAKVLEMNYLQRLRNLSMAEEKANKMQEGLNKIWQLKALRVVERVIGTTIKLRGFRKLPQKDSIDDTVHASEEGERQESAASDCIAEEDGNCEDEEGQDEEFEDLRLEFPLKAGVPAFDSLACAVGVHCTEGDHARLMVLDADADELMSQQHVAARRTKQELLSGDELLSVDGETELQTMLNRLQQQAPENVSEDDTLHVQVRRRSVEKAEQLVHESAQVRRKKSGRNTMGMIVSDAVGAHVAPEMDDDGVPAGWQPDHADLRRQPDPLAWKSIQEDYRRLSLRLPVPLRSSAPLANLLGCDLGLAAQDADAVGVTLAQRLIAMNAVATGGDRRTCKRLLTGDHLVQVDGVRDAAGMTGILGASPGEVFEQNSSGMVFMNVEVLRPRTAEEAENVAASAILWKRRQQHSSHVDDEEDGDESSAAEESGWRTDNESMLQIGAFGRGHKQQSPTTRSPARRPSPTSSPRPTSASAEAEQNSGADYGACSGRRWSPSEDVPTPAMPFGAEMEAAISGLEPADARRVLEAMFHAEDWGRGSIAQRAVVKDLIVAAGVADQNPGDGSGGSSFCGRRLWCSLLNGTQAVAHYVQPHDDSAATGETTRGSKEAPATSRASSMSIARGSQVAANVITPALYVEAMMMIAMAAKMRDRSRITAMQGAWCPAAAAVEVQRRLAKLDSELAWYALQRDHMRRARGGVGSSALAVLREQQRSSNIASGNRHGPEAHLELQLDPPVRKLLLGLEDLWRRRVERGLKQRLSQGGDDKTEAYATSTSAEARRELKPTQGLHPKLAKQSPMGEPSRLEAAAMEPLPLLRQGPLGLSRQHGGSPTLAAAGGGVFASRKSHQNHGSVTGAAVNTSTPVDLTSYDVWKRAHATEVIAAAGRGAVLPGINSSTGGKGQARGRRRPVQSVAGAHRRLCVV